MSLGERYWWSAALIGVLELLAVPVILIWTFSNPPQVGPYFTADERNQYVALAIFLLVVCVGAGLVMLAIALRGRRRARLRRAALRGDLDAMPLSRFVPDASAAPDVANEPLQFAWRATRSLRYTRGIAILLQCLALLVMLIGPPASAWSMRITSAHAQLTFDAGTVGLVVYTVIALIAAVLFVVVMARILSRLLFWPFGVTATASGVEQRTQFGGKRYLRWEDMRLFEVESVNVTDRFYCVHSDRRRVEWRDPPGNTGEYKPVGITPDEMARRHRLLVDLIYARTGLAPRTLSKALQSSQPEAEAPQAPVGAPTSTGNGWSTWGAALIVLAFAALVAGAAVAAIMLPASPYAALNVVIAISLALGALALVVVAGWIVVRLMISDRDYPPPQAPVATAPALAGTEGMRTLSYRMTPLVRAALILGGMLLLSNLIPLLLIFWDVIVGIFRPPMYSMAVASSYVPPLAYVLMLPGGVGVVLLRMAFQEGRLRVQADLQGISRALGRQTVALRWDGVERVAAQARNGRIVSYLLTGELGMTQISWRARSTWYLRLVTAPSAAAITPDEMAALAARESGKKLEIEPAP